MRITTSPPPPKEPSSTDAKRVSLASGSEDVEHEVNQTIASDPTATGLYAYPETTTAATTNAATTPLGGVSNGDRLPVPVQQQQQRSGLLGNVTNFLPRPGFLRNLSMRATNTGTSTGAAEDSGTRMTTTRGPGTGTSAVPMTATELVDLERGRVTAMASGM